MDSVFFVMPPSCSPPKPPNAAEKVIHVIDEAHLLDPDQLEAVRLLTNADKDSASPMAGLLVGQPTLRRRIKLGPFAALDRRITLRYAMPGTDLAETKACLAPHLAPAGRSDTLFSDDPIALIHQASRGLARAVNNHAVQSRPSPAYTIRP